MREFGHLKRIYLIDCKFWIGTICRFESLTLSHNNMIALKPVLHSWLEQAESDSRVKRKNDEVMSSSSSLTSSSSVSSISMNSTTNNNNNNMNSSTPNNSANNSGSGLLSTNSHNINSNMSHLSNVNNSLNTVNGNSQSNHHSSHDRKRKRTSIAAPEKRSLETFFTVQPRPSGEKIAQIAEKLELKKNVVRVWFCNQRQKQKRMKFNAVQGR